MVCRREAGVGIAVMCTVLLLTPAVASAAQTHTVQSGETLWAIAVRYHVPVGAIVGANRLADPDVLPLGQRLVIPAPARARRAPVAAVLSPSGRPGIHGGKQKSTVAAVVSPLVGIRYRWGGSTLEGFDCSGFIGYVLGKMGVRVPRTTYAMYAQGLPIMKSDLQIGDVVFFQTVSPGPSHAGIYLGGTTFIHASSASGRVTVTSLEDHYYRPRLLGARRFF